MVHPRRFRVLLSISAALVPALAITQSPSTAPSQSTARFEPVECFAPIRGWATQAGIECGWLTIPEARERPNGPIVRLAVARMRAKNPSGAPPIVYLHGGPGGPGAIATSSLEGFAALSNTVRDVVMFDQRAVGLSEPKVCDDQSLNPSDSLLAPQERWNAEARRCIASIRAQGRDPLAYTTPVAAADVQDLRRALGYTKWDLYGVSYGGRLALATMRRDPDGIRAVIVGSPAAPAHAVMTEDPISVQRSLERVFSACAAQSSCKTAFPTLEQDFYAIYDSLTHHPKEVRIERSTSSIVIRLDGAVFLKDVRCQLTNSRKIERIPLMINELRRGDQNRAASVLVEDCLALGRAGGGGNVNVKNYLTNCYDGHGPAFWQGRNAVRARVRPMWLVFEEGGEECDIWQERFADSSESAPVRSDIPTLILTGEFDERTPTDVARRAVVGLTRKYFYEIPGESHGNRAVGCHAEIMMRFLADPTHQPDTTCIANIPKIAFATSNLIIPNLTLAIAADANSARFAGNWEAELPSAPRPFRVDLAIRQLDVAGMWHPNELPIFGGRAVGDTIRFSVKSPDGSRTVSFAGVLHGDQLLFTRDVQVPPGSTTVGGQGIFGVGGVRNFTATRSRVP